MKHCQLNSRYLRGAILVCLLFASSAAVFGAFEEDSSGARARGMAGAYCAAADDSEAIFSQPAGLARLQTPEMAVTYGKLFTGLNDGSNINDGIVSIGWPLSPRAGVGLGYKTVTLDNAYSETVIVGGCALRPRNWLSVGIDVKYLNLRYGTDDYTRQDPLLAARSSKSAYDVDAGLLVALSPALSLAYVRQNSMGADIGLAETVTVPPRDRLGLAYREESFLMSAEYVQMLPLVRYLAGVEKYFARGLFAMRLGMGWGSLEFRKIAAGLRVTFRQFSVDYAFDIPVGGIEGTSGTHYVTLVARFAGQKIKPAAPEKTARITAPQKLELPGMTSGQPAVSTVPAFVPELLPPPTSCLRTPVSAALNFDAAMSSTTERIGMILQTSTNTVIAEPPQAAPKHKTAISGAPPVEQLPLNIDGVPAPGTAVVAGDTSPSVTTKKPKPTSVDAPSAGSARPAGPARTCRVAAGDTLPALAERFYGNKSAWTKIYDANKDRIEKGSLEPGEILIIP